MTVWGQNVKKKQRHLKTGTVIQESMKFTQRAYMRMWCQTPGEVEETEKRRI